RTSPPSCGLPPRASRTRCRSTRRAATPRRSRSATSARTSPCRPRRPTRSSRSTTSRTWVTRRTDSPPDRPHEVGRGSGPYHARMSDRLYFRQLLSGLDLAEDDGVAQQMVNFIYLIGDRETGEAVVVDPAYDPQALVDVAAADGMTLVGALATHYHPDPVGGSMMGHGIAGITELLELAEIPIHVQADEAE